MDYRVILYHKQATSARTRFLKIGDDSVCAFSPLPMPAAVLDQYDATTINHPAAILQAAEKRLGFPVGSLKAEGDYKQMVDVAGETIQIILGEITTIDPPFDEAEKAGASFIDLTQARGLPTVELKLLRSAYELVLGG